MMIGERDFFAVARRIYDAMYEDAQGTKRPIARDMKEAQVFGMPNSNGKAWTKRTINSASLVSCNGREIWYAPQNDPGDISGLSTAVQRIYKSTTGIVQIFNPGIYYFCTPLVGADVEGTTLPAMLRDSAQGSDAQLPVNQVIGGEAGVDSIVDIEKIGGTAQTPGLDLGALLKPITWGADSGSIAYSAADDVAIPASATRRGLSIFNEDASETVAFGTGTMTRLAGIFIVPPLRNLILGPLDFPPTAALRSWGSGAGNFSYRNGT